MTAPRIVSAIALIAGLISLPCVATALGPADACWKKTLTAAAKLAGAVAGCEASTALDTTDPEALLEACVVPKRTAFDAAWDAAHLEAARSGGDCSALSSPEVVRARVENVLVTLRSQILVQIPPDAKPRVVSGLVEELLSESGSFARGSLKAQAAFAKTGDGKAAKKARRKLRKAFEASWSERMTWAQGKNVAFNLDPTGPSAEVDALVDGVRDSTRPFTSKKGVRDVILADSLSGEAPHTVRFGYFSSSVDDELEWHLGDGTVLVAGQSVEHTYEDAGNHPVRVMRPLLSPNSPVEEVARLDTPVRVTIEALVLQDVHQEGDWQMSARPHVAADGSRVLVVGNEGLTVTRLRRHAPDGTLELDIDLAPLGLDEVDKATSDDAGNIYVTGIRNISTNNWYAQIAKFDPLGNLLWDRTISSPQAGIPTVTNSHLQVDQVVVSPDGLVYLALHEWAQLGQPSTVAAVSEAGALLWAAPAATRPATGEPIRGLALATNGDVLALDGEGAVYRYAPDGTLAWSDAFTPTIGNLSSSRYDGIVACSDGGALLMRGGSAPAFLTRITAAGGVLWEAGLPITASLRSRAGGIAGDCEDRLIVFGWDASPDDLGSGNSTHLLVQIAPDGSEIRRRRVFTNFNIANSSMAVRLDQEGNVHLLGNIDEFLPGSPASGSPGYALLEYSVETTAEVPSAQAESEILSGSAPLPVPFDASLSGDANASVADYRWSIWDAPRTQSGSREIATATGEQAEITLNHNSGGRFNHYADVTVTYKDGGRYRDDLVVEVGPRPPPELTGTWQQHAGVAGALTQNLIIKGTATSGGGSLRTWSYDTPGIDGTFVKFNWTSSGSSMTFSYKEVLFCDFFKGKWVRDNVPGGTVPISLSHTSLNMNGVTYIRASKPRKNSVPGGTPVKGGSCSLL